jgi:hypothetical protein
VSRFQPERLSLNRSLTQIRQPRLRRPGPPLKFQVALYRKKSQPVGSRAETGPQKTPLELATFHLRPCDFEAQFGPPPPMYLRTFSLVRTPLNTSASVATPASRFSDGL